MIETRNLKLALILTLAVLPNAFLYSPQKEAKETLLQVDQRLHQLRLPTEEQIRELSRMFMGSHLPEDVLVEIEQVLRTQGFNGTVALARKGEVLYRGGFGLADFVKKRPISIDNQFQLASVSKQFTAMAVMMLVEEGKLSYDDLFTDYVPEFPYDTVTVRHLLNHTAGMPNYMYLMERYWKKESLPDNEDMLDLMIQYKPGLYFTPGRRFDYSNTGYALLALLIERLSGKRFDQYLQDEIFDPLGMWDSYVYSPTSQEKGARQLSGHHRYRRRWVPTPDTLHEAVLGDKGIYSTIEDMLKWDRALYQGTLLPADHMEKAYEPLTLRNGRHWQYGFGFRIEDNPLEKVVFHYGRWNSFSTCIIRNLDSEYTLILLSNVKRNLEPIQKRIRDILPQGEPVSPLEKLLRTLPLDLMAGISH